VTISGRAAKLLIGAFAVSLLLNFAAVGFFGVVAGGAMVGIGMLRQAAAPFPEPLRQAFRADLAAHRGELIAAFRDLRAAREHLHAVITAASLDQAAAAAAQAELRQRADAVIDLLQAAVLRSVATLPDEVRRSIPDVTPGGQLLRGLIAAPGDESAPG
jgi:hypothetical protein